MRQNKIITRFSILLGMLFFWGNSFAQISVSINQQTMKQNKTLKCYKITVIRNPIPDNRDFSERIYDIIKVQA